MQLVYNFLEQGNWAVKTGLIRNKRRKEFINRWANYTELLTYVFSVQLAGLGLRECSRQVEEAEGELRRRNARKKDDGDGDGDGDEGPLDDVDKVLKAGLHKLNAMQLTHSLKAPGFKPLIL